MITQEYYEIFHSSRSRINIYLIVSSDILKEAELSFSFANDIEQNKLRKIREKIMLAAWKTRSISISAR